MPYTALAPNQAAFGTEQDAYLKALMAKSVDPTADAVNMLNLGNQARGSSGDYLAALREANAQQMAGANAENDKDIAQAYITSGGNLAKEGVSGAILPNATNRYLRVSPDRLTSSDAVHQQDMYLGGVKNASEAVKNIAEAGFKLPDETVGSMITPAMQTTPNKVFKYLSPQNKAKQEEADAAMVAANAAKYRAEKNGEGKNVDKTVTTLISDGHGGFIPIGQAVTTKGAPAAADDTPKHKGHWVRDPKTNQSKWIEDGK